MEQHPGNEAIELRWTTAFVEATPIKIKLLTSREGEWIGRIVAVQCKLLFDDHHVGVSYGPALNVQGEQQDSVYILVVGCCV